MYMKIISPTNFMLWIKYCQIFSALPSSLQIAIKEITNLMNNKYNDELIIPFGLTVQNGCVVKPGKIEDVANDLYNMYNVMMNRYHTQPCIRLVYSVGEIEDDISNVDSIHYLGNYGVIVKVGTILDASDDVGIFRV